MKKSRRRFLALAICWLLSLSAASGSAATKDLLRGGDISELTYIEDMGGEFRDEQGKAADCLYLLKQRGWNIVRIRNYNDPGKGRGDGTYYCQPGYLDEQDNLALARRAKAKGMAIEYSFHYSDYWTNGGIQNIPAAWQEKIKGLSDADAVNVLEMCVYDYTKKVLEDLKAQGTVPEYISLGNEIQGGMLFPYGAAVKDSWPNLARFFNAGARAVREVCPQSKIILHLDDAGNDWKYETFFGYCQKLHVDYDILGGSYYPFFTQKSAKEIGVFAERMTKEFHRPMILMETGFSWNPVTADGTAGQLPNNGPYAMTKEAQTDFMRELFSTMHAAKGPGLIGDLYWDPIFIHHENVGWAMLEATDQTDKNVVDNTTLFDFAGKALPVMEAYREDARDEAAFVSGQVIGRDGRALAGAKVTLTAGGKELTQETDRYGNYLFPDVPAGAARVRAASAGYTGDAAAELTVAPKGESQVETLTLTGAQVAGRVTDERGAALLGATVRVTPAGSKRSFETQTAADGSFVLADLPAAASYTLAAERPGYLENSAQIAGLRSGASETASLALTQDSGTLVGEVWSNLGTPVADISITATAPDGTIFTAKTDGTGRYVLPDIKAGAGYTVTAGGRADFLDATYPEKIDVRNRATRDGVSFTLTKDTFTLSGEVKNEDGTPAAQARVYVTGGKDWQTHRAETDAAGRYCFERLLSGTYELCAKHLDKADAIASAKITGAAGENLTAGTLRFPVGIELKNPSFEIWGTDKFDVSGWQTSGTKNAIVVQGQASHEGKLETAMWLDEPFTGRLEQNVGSLPAGRYTLSAWIMSKGTEPVCYMYIRDGQGEEHRLNLWTANAWSNARLTVDIPAGVTAIGFYTEGNAADWLCMDDVSLVREF